MAAIPEQAELINRLQATPLILQKLLTSPGGLQLRWQNQEDNLEWSIATVMGHLAHVDRNVWQPRILRLLEERDRPAQLHSRPDLREEGPLHERNSESLFTELLYERTKTLALLRQAMDKSEALPHFSSPPSLSPFELGQRILVHDEEHLQQIKELLPVPPVVN